MTAIPAGIRKVYNYFYKKKSLEGSSMFTPTQIKEYFVSFGFDVDAITDEQFNQAVDYFSKGELALVEQDKPLTFLEEEQRSPIEPEPEPQPERSQMIKSQAQALGIVLNDAEIVQIASNLNESSDDLHDSLDDIKSAIIAFVRYKSSLNGQRISEVIEEINNVVADELSSNSRKLTQGLESINHNMQQQNADFKSKVKSAIAVFAIPPAG
jgi:hypothetical protein